MFEAFCKEKLGPLALRLALGLVCVYHGYVKIMAAGGTAWQPELPVIWQLALAWGEFVAGIAIVIGFRCRIAAGMVLAILVGTLIWWRGWGILRLPPQTLETTLVLLFLGLALVFLGAGELSLDARGGGKLAGAPAFRRR